MYFVLVHLRRYSHRSHPFIDTIQLEALNPSNGAMSVRAYLDMISITVAGWVDLETAAHFAVAGDDGTVHAALDMELKVGNDRSVLQVYFQGLPPSTVFTVETTSCLLHRGEVCWPGNELVWGFETGSGPCVDDDNNPVCLNNG
jgi:hypothetical protein